MAAGFRTVTAIHIHRLAPVLVALALCAATALEAAPVPELPNPSAASGGPTTARFFAGTTVDEGASFISAVNPTTPADVLAEFRVEAGHVGSLGNLYVVATAYGQYYVRTPDGGFVLWDGNIAGLTAAVPNKLLASLETLTILDNIRFGDAGVNEAEVAFYLAYDSVQRPGELYYSGTPLGLRIAPTVQSQIDPFRLYTETVSGPIVQNRCVICHVAGGLAGSSRLVYLRSNQPDYQQINYNTIANFVLNVPGGSDLILSKPTGLSHGGGVQLGDKSSEYAAWSALVSALLGNQGSGQAESAFSTVALLDPQATLRKAALLLAGRLPTSAEIASLGTGDDNALRAAIRNLMQGNGFEQFLIDGSNDRLLTKAFTGNLFAIVDRYYYPKSMQYFQERNLPGSPRQLTSEALALEPLKLIAHVVMNERPYTEVLTANYIMVNPFSAGVYGSNVQFANPNDPGEWRESLITEYYRCSNCNRTDGVARYDIPTVYPHAGILNSPAFLSRFPSTSTNRNRARARWAFYFFLGVDIEGLSERTTDPDALADENNPTLNNPNCTVCHDIMDPVAGTFQNYGDKGYYRDQQGGLNSLPGSYRRDPAGLYQPGDTWYADMLAPGFAGRHAPDPANSLQWLAREFVADPRFGYGTVNFWYPAVIGREPLVQPDNPDDPDYEARLAAYGEEQAFLKALAKDFVNGSRGNGSHNLKDLLVDLVVSEYFRSASSSDGAGASPLLLEDVGVGRLLSPEQLQRKLKDATGFNWGYGRFVALTEVYGLIYGGIDSFSITERATELTTLMSSVVSVMANETSCAMAAQDFGRPRSERLLFRDVELSSLPTTSPHEIRANIRYLHERLLGENVAVDSPEVNATYALFSETWNARIAAGKSASVSSGEEFCLLENAVNPVTNDPQQTLRSWAVVLNYLLRDYRFIHE